MMKMVKYLTQMAFNLKPLSRKLFEFHNPKDREKNSNRISMGARGQT